MSEPSKPTGPDLAQGIPLDDLADGGMIGGHVGEEPVLLARRGDEFFAIGSACSHYGGPLAEGLAVGDTVRCPWHHARFSLRTGEAIGAPAFNPVACWRVDKRDGKACVRDKIEPSARRRAVQARSASENAERVVIVGGGAAAFATAEMLRREGFAGSVTLLSLRRRRSLRPAELLEGLSRRQRAGRLDPAQAGRILPRACDRRRARHQCHRHRREGATGGCRGRAKRGLRQARARDRRRADSPRHSRRERAARPRAALARRRTRDHRKRKGGAARRRGGRELHRARGRRVPARPRARGPCRGPRAAADGAHPRP